MDPTEIFDKEGILGLNKVQSSVSLDEIDVEYLSRDGFSERNGYNNKKESYIPARDISIQSTVSNLIDDSGEEDSSEDGNLSSDDSDVEIMNAPLLPTWVSPPNILRKIGSNIWSQSVQANKEDIGELGSTKRTEKGANGGAHDDTKVFASPYMRNKVGIEDHDEFPPSHVALNDRTICFYQVFHSIAIYILDFIGVGMVAMGNVVLDLMENTLQAFALRIKDRTEPP